MKKLAVIIVAIFILTVIISSVITVRPDSFLSSTLFTISGIMFSIGLSLTVTFNLTGISNENYIRKIRSNLNHIRNLFIFYFFFAMFCYILSQYVFVKDIILFSTKYFSVLFNFIVFFVLIIIYSIIYFIINFLSIQKLSNDIFDRIQYELSKKK